VLGITELRGFAPAPKSNFLPGVSPPQSFFNLSRGKPLIGHESQDDECYRRSGYDTDGA